MKLFLDTWGWLVLSDKKDPAYTAVSKFYRDFRQKGGGAYSSDYILDETLTLLFRKAPFAQARKYMEGVLQMAKEGYLQLERVTPQRFEKAWELRLRYEDKPGISFTDLTSFVIMRELGAGEVLTEDSHFEGVNLSFLRVPRLPSRIR